MSGERILVVASYPPMPGEASAAALAAILRIYADGNEPVVVSPRPTAAHLWAPVVGHQAGGEIDRLRQSYGTDWLVLGLEAGLPFSVGASTRRQQEEVAMLVRILGRFRHVSALVTGDLGLDPALLAPLWRYTHEVVVSSPGVADPLGERLSTASLLGPPPFLPREQPRRVASLVARRVLGRHTDAVRAQVVPLVQRARALVKG
jgi:hypothetical protein